MKRRLGKLIGAEIVIWIQAYNIFGDSFFDGVQVTRSDRRSGVERRSIADTAIASYWILDQLDCSSSIRVPIGKHASRRHNNRYKNSQAYGKYRVNAGG